MKCWKCGTACKEDPAFGWYCPAKDCDVFDGLNLTPAQLAESVAMIERIRGPARELTAEERRDVEALAEEAEKRGLILLSKPL